MDPPHTLKPCTRGTRKTLQWPLEEEASHFLIHSIHLFLIIILIPASLSILCFETETPKTVQEIEVYI